MENSKIRNNDKTDRIRKMRSLSVLSLLLSNYFSTQ